MDSTQLIYANIRYRLIIVTISHLPKNKLNCYNNCAKFVKKLSMNLDISLFKLSTSMLNKEESTILMYKEFIEDSNLISNILTQKKQSYSLR